MIESPGGGDEGGEHRDCPDLGVFETRTISDAVREHVDGCAACQVVLDVFAWRAGSADECARFDALLAARDDGALNAAGASLLERHLVSCASCRAVAETLSPPGGGGSDQVTLPDVDPDDYAMGSEIRRGGMGRIVTARDLRVGRPVAVKELLGRSPQLATRFEREARVTARLQHPGIIPIYEIGKWPDGTPFYTMRMVDGSTMGEVIDRTVELDRRLALLPAMIAACEAVAFAHGQRVIHRDLTPSNILIGDYGETVVIDWGLAKDLGDPAEEESAEVSPAASDRLTNVGVVLGTIPYMSPEQAQGKTVDERTDVYALGAILYHLLSGTAPFRARDRNELLYAVRTLAPQPIDEVAPNAPRDLRSIVSKAMARDPGQRYPSAREVAQELQRFQTGRLVEAHSYSLGERIKRFLARNRAAVVIAALAIVFLGGVGVISLRNVYLAKREAQATARELLFEKGRVELLAGNKLRALAYLHEASRQGTAGPELELLLGNAVADLVADPPLDCGSDDRFLALSPDGSLLAAACNDHARLWRVRDNAVAITPVQVAMLDVPGAPGAFDQLAFSHDGKRLVTWGDDGIARVWQLELTGKPQGKPLELRHARPGGATPLTRCSFSADDRTVASAGNDGNVRIWDAATGALKRELPANPLSEAITTTVPVTRVFGNLTTGSDGRLRMVTLGFQGVAKGFDVETGDLLGRFELGLVAGGDISADGRHAVACGLDAVVKVIDLETGDIEAELIGHTDVVWKCVFSADSTRVLTASHDRTARVWDIARPHHPRLVAAATHGELIWTAKFSPDGNRFVTVSPGRSMKVWDATSGTLLATYPTRGKDAVFLPDGRLAALRGDGKIQLWNFAGVRLAAFSPRNGASVVGVTPDGGCTIIERDGLALIATATGAPIATPLALTSPFATAPHRVAAVYLEAPSADSPQTRWGIAVIDLVRGTTKKLPIETAAVPGLPSTIQLAGDRIALVRSDRDVEVWDIATGRRVATLAGARHALLDDTGRRAITWTDGATPHAPEVWTVDTGAHLSLTAVDARPIGFGSGGDRVVLSELASTNAPVASIWDATTGRKLFQQQTVAISPTIDPSGRWLTTISSDREVTVTALDDGTPRASFNAEPLQHVQANPDATLVVAVGDYGRAVLVLAASDGRVLARYDLDHDRAQVRSDQFQAPSSVAWWLPDGAAIASRAKGVSLWRAKNPYGDATIAELVKKYVPWRIVDGRLEVIRNGRITGHVMRSGEPVAGAVIEVLVRRAADISDQPVTWDSMKARLTMLATETGADGWFVIENLEAGELEYLVTASAGDVRSQPQAAFGTPDDPPLELELP